MSKSTILVAGATGIVGREVTRLLRERGYRTRAFSRNPARAQALRAVADEIAVGDATKQGSLSGVMQGVDGVISCLGAPVSFTWAERRPYRDVDTVANHALIQAAREAGVSRFIYVSIHVQPGYADTAYVRAHERVVEELRASGLCFGVIRPTGIFPIFDPFVLMARRGPVSIPGDGTSRTNPVHSLDVAEACVEALAAECGVSLAVGGPDILTRHEIVELAFRAVGKSPRIIHTPRFLAIAAGAIVRPLHPRIGEMIDFAAHVFSSECVAPQRGRRGLAEHFARVAASG